MPERINTVFCRTGESYRFFSSSISRNTATKFNDWSGRELYRQICARNSDEERPSGENSRFENQIVDEQQQQLRWELQRILQQAHENNRSLKHTA
jgi:hypothetical protein